MTTDPHIPTAVLPDGEEPPLLQPVAMDPGPVPQPAPTEECPACGNSQGRVLFRTHDQLGQTAADRAFPWLVVECLGCHLLRLSPWPKAGEVSRHYPKGFWSAPEPHSRIEELYRKFRLWDQVHFVDSGLRRGGLKGPVVDVAGRGGWFQAQMAARGWPVATLEFDISAAAAAWHGRRVASVCGTLPNAPFRPGSLAAITMFGVLEHLFDPVAHLEAARQLLQPGGRLYVQVPNASSWQFLLLGERWAGLDAPRHLIHYRPHDLEILFDRCGFDVERTKYFSLAENPAMLAGSLVRSLVPETRRLTGRVESQGVRLAKDLGHQALSVALLPFTVFEAACHAGATVMMEARVRTTGSSG